MECSMNWHAKVGFARTDFRTKISSYTFYEVISIGFRIFVIE
jgi:hypothetical protein